MRNKFPTYRKLAIGLSLLVFAVMMTITARAQETTGSFQGTVKDPSGAAVADAHVTVTGEKLIGKKDLKTDRSGFYRFANLLPGTYTVVVEAPGFTQIKRSGIIIVVGGNPTIDIPLAIGTENTVVEVGAEAPIVDVTESKVQTVVTREQLNFVPRGASFQSVIAFAPGANNEPLQGGIAINGAATSENSYLIEGQNTQGLISGTSQANMPFEFIDQVQVKTGGFEAQYGGALGGVAEALERKGSNAWHGEVWTYYLSSGLDASPAATLRYDPQASVPSASDVPTQYYNPIKDHYRTIRPGFIAAGYLRKDRIWVTLGYQPNLYSLRRTSNFNVSNCKGTLSCTGPYIFTQDAQSQYAIARVDAKLSERFRAYGSWVYQFYRTSGSSLPNADSKDGLYNTTSTSNPLNYNHGIGNVQPNLIVNAGLDETFTHNLIGTTRYGYFYQNYQDRGLPTGIRYVYQASALNMLPLSAVADTTANRTSTTPTGFVQASGFDTLGANSTYLANQQSVQTFSQDISFFKKGFFGLHNVQIGYLLNHAYHNENLAYNTGLVYLYPGTTSGGYTPIDSFAANCVSINAANMNTYNKIGWQKDPADPTGTHYIPKTGTQPGCQGNYGYAVVREYGTIGHATDNNHGLYFQDKWTIASRFTANVGLRIEKEYLPSYNKYATGISYGWGDKLSPRLGAAYDVLGNGKLKVTASYAVFYDVMKLNLAIDSFGGAYWHNCTYAWDSLDYTTINPVRGSDGHYCSGTGNANFGSGSVPSNLRFIENQDYRIPSNDPSSGAAVDPNLKPYRQHQATAGLAYQLSRTWGLEATYVRNRLDHAIEDAGLLGPNGEYFLIVNPGEGVDYQPVAGCTTCKNQPKAARNYDAIDVRVSHLYTPHWQLRADYTYSRLRGNYSGLTNSDISDAGGARNNPNDNRSFDEPYFQFTAAGKSFNGLLPTDRPHRLKFDGYYSHTLVHKFDTSFGIFEQIYSGTPLSSYMDVQQTAGSYPVYVEGRGKWVDVTTDSSGTLTFSSPYTKRTPAYIQTDGNFTASMRVSDAHEGWRLGFEWYASNLFNQKAATVIQSHINTSQSRSGNYIKPSATLNYAVLENGYDYKTLANSTSTGTGAKIVEAGTYGRASGFQTGRSMRMKVKFTF